MKNRNNPGDILCNRLANIDSNALLVTLQENLSILRDIIGLTRYQKRNADQIRGCQ